VCLYWLCRLLERDEVGRVGGASQACSDGELAQVVTSHLGLDFRLTEGLVIAHPK
jgi:hypothetical protein